MSWRRALAAVAVLAALAGCNKDKDVAPPAELVEIKPTLAVQKLWSEGVGGGSEKLLLTLGVAGDGSTVYAAAQGGDVVALDAATGRERWKTDTKLDLSAGPGIGEGLVVVGTSDGDVVALDEATGKQRWKSNIPGELLSPALVYRDKVVLRSVEGRLRALSAADGKEQWLVEDLVPRLSLRGTATPVGAGDVVVSGFDSGKVMSVTLASGEILWQTQVATPHGRSELERLSDVDSAVKVSGNDVYAVGYQGRVAMIALDTGQIWWARDVSSYRGLAIDDDQLYVASSDGDVVALRRRDGTVLWTQSGLKHRGLSPPAVVGNAVVVGDFEGYLHFLDRSTGKFVAREKAGGKRIAAPPLVMGDRVYVIDEGGRLAAYRVGGAAGA
ncbi:MAG: outer membrane protein assembly factor BamB [Gammaproteobacteria bacterium]|nr:outer membrane protein assembly factor BamB [Gammaproteobacteria bacterium]